MNRTKSLISLMMTIILALSVIGCGKAQTAEPATESGSSESASVNSDTSSGSESNEVTSSSGEQSLKVYLVGDDKIGIVLRSDSCEKVAAKPGQEDGDSAIRVSMDKGGFSFEARYGYINFDIGNGNYSSHGLDSYNGGMVLAGKNMAYIESNAKGICDEAIFEGDYTVYLSSKDLSNGDEIFSGNFSNAVTKVSEEEYAEILVRELDDLVCVTPAEANWSGYYFTDNYSDFAGYFKGEVLSGGLVHLSGEVDDQKTEVYGFEQNLEVASYDYGSYTNANLFGVTLGNDRIADVSLYKDMYGGNLGYSEHSTEGGSTFISTSLYQLVTDKHYAPDNYEDKDVFNLFSRNDPDDSKYFKTKSDDYVIKASKPSSMYYGSGSGESVPCISYELAGFDTNEMMCESYHKYVFENEADAKKVYDYLSKRDYSNSEISGVVVYEWYDDTSHYPKLSYIGYDWFAECNYIYDPGNIDSEYASCEYLSKPVEAKRADVSMDSLLFFKKFPSGSHRSFETPDATLYVYMDSDYNDFSVNDYRADNERMLGSSGANIHIDGTNVVSINYVGGYSPDYSAYEYFVAVSEFSFSDDGVATVTEMRYKVDEGYKNVDITFDNYKSKTPDKTVTLTFDMLHIIE